MPAADLAARPPRTDVPGTLQARTDVSGRMAPEPDPRTATELTRDDDRRAGEPMSQAPSPRPESAPIVAPGPAPVIAGATGPDRTDAGAACTAPQLRRFIKSRPYVPMHELRRRFGINGADDDVTAVGLPNGTVYVGLPHREGTLLGELLRGGDIGYELSLDPRSPVVIGLYPMRPVARS